MSTIQDAYINALLADAAYVDLTQNMSPEAMVGALKDRLTPTLATYLAANFEVASAVNTSDIPLYGSGFDAVVWRGKAGSEFAGQVFVSMRGTEVLPGADLLADGDLAFNSGARSQLIDMVNWWLRARTPAGQSAQQIAWDPLLQPDPNSIVVEPGFVAATSVAGTGELVGITDVHVNGHSLGGHLAAAFARIFGGSVIIDDISTFNSAGFNASAEPMFTQLQALLGTGLSAFAGDKQTNYYSENGTTFTTNTWWFTQMGARIGLYQEEGTGIDNHLIYKQTDLLALGAVLEKLDSTMTFGKFNELIKAGSNKTEGSIEGVLDGLRKALAGPNVVPMPIGDVSDSASSRVSYHATLADLQANPIFKDLAGQLDIQVTGAGLGASARDNFGALIALQDLSPIYISGKTTAAKDELAAIWQIGRAADYAAWMADKSAATPGTFTDQWIADRAALLQAINTRNKQDNSTGLIYDVNAKAGQVTVFQYYGDAPPTGQTQPGLQMLLTQNSAVAGLPEQFIAFGDGGANSITGTDNVLSDHLYGGGGDDAMDGKGGDDYLEGGTGADTLDGGNGNDYLLGGTGNDSYQFSSLFGLDTVIDSDGQGSLNLGTTTLSGGKQIADGVWESDDKQYRYTQVEGQLIVSLNAANGAALNGDILVKDWSASQLGLTLQGQASGTTPLNVMTGDFIKKTNDAGTELLLRADGNYVNGGVQAGALDLITGSAGADLIQGLGGDDALLGLAGDDVIEGGDGNDVLQGGLGRDTINGGSGNEIIYGSSTGSLTYPVFTDWAPLPSPNPIVQGQGYNWVSSSPGADADGIQTGTLTSTVGRDQQADDDGNLIDGGAGQDFIYAGTGSDVVHGGADTDDVYGMAGNDVLFGDGGNDRIYGDGTNDATRLTYTPPAQHGYDLLVGGAGNDLLLGQGKDDILFGGADDDVMYGDDRDDTNTPVEIQGNDYLDGGSGVDKLIGNGGDDILIGGKDNDTLYGGAGNDTYIYNGGDGIDTLYDDFTTPGANTLRFGAGVIKDNIKLREGSLLLDLGNGDQIHIEGFNTQDVFNSVAIGRFEFADGSMLTSKELLARGTTNEQHYRNSFERKAT